LKYSIRDLKRINPVVRCDTYEQAESLLRHLAEQGIWDVPQTAAVLRRYHENGAKTCYRLFEAGWCDVDYYRSIRKEIVDFEDVAAVLGISYTEVVPVSFSLSAADMFR